MTATTKIHATAEIICDSCDKRKITIMKYRPITAQDIDKVVKDKNWTVYMMGNETKHMCSLCNGREK